MATVKVHIGDEFRRFGIAKTASWSDVEAKLRELLNVPTLDDFNVSYVDEDGDAIVVDSDLELRELLQRPTPLRLSVERRGVRAASASPTATSEDSDGVEVDHEGSQDDFVDLMAADNHGLTDTVGNAASTPTPPPAAATPAAAPTTRTLAETVIVEDVPDESESAMDTDTDVRAAAAASATASSAASASASSAAGSSTAGSSKPAQQQQQQQRPQPQQDPLASLMEQFHTLVQTAVERNGDLIERGGQLFEQFAVEAQQQAEAARRAHAERVHAAWAERRAAYEAHRAAWVAAHQPSRREATGKVCATETDAATDAGRAYMCQPGDGGCCGSEAPAEATAYYARRCGPAVYGRRCGPRFDATPSRYAPAYADHLALLNELGFVDDEVNQQLLHLFDGNIAAVVDALSG